jgi:hypothetical protein
MQAARAIRDCDSEGLNKWLGREVGGEPVQVATAGLDLSRELKRGLAFVRQQRKR